MPWPKATFLHLAQQQWLLGNSSWTHSYLPALGFPDILVTLLGGFCRLLVTFQGIVLFFFFLKKGVAFAQSR